MARQESPELKKTEEEWANKNRDRVISLFDHKQRLHARACLDHIRSKKS